MRESANEHHCNKISTSQIPKCNNAPRHIIATATTQVINLRFIDFYKHVSNRKVYSSNAPIFLTKHPNLRDNNIWYYSIV